MKLIKLLAVVIVGLIVTNVTLTNRAVDQAVTVSELSAEITALDHDNTILNAEIAELGSLSTIAGGIEAAGFVDSPKVVSLQSGSSLASR